MRPIDADELLEKFTKAKKSGVSLKDAIYLDGVMAVIDGAQTIPAPVKCGECIYYVDCEGGLCTHPKLQNDETPPTQKDRSCSYGKRKDGDSNA